MAGARTWSLALVLLAGACAESHPTANATAQTRLVDAAAGSARYLALGDSFTIGTGTSPPRAFPARLAERWRMTGCSLELMNVAVNGYTSDDVITNELAAVSTFRPTFVTVAIGANDIVHGTSVAAYRLNVRRILDAASAYGAHVVAIPQPSWWRSPAAASFGAAELIAEAIAAFNAVLAEEARARGAVWVDLAPLMREQAANHQLASDRLHPSADAYDGWAAELARLLPSPCGR